MRFATLAFALAPLLMVAGDSVRVDSIQKRDRPFKIEHESGSTIQAIYVDGDDWAYLPEEHFIREDHVTYMAAPVGRYLITDGTAKIVNVIDEGRPRPEPKPDPRPDPGPDPDPNPDPDDQKLRLTFVVWIEEIQDRAKHPEETLVMQDAGLRRVVADLGAKSRTYDKDQPGASSFVEIAKAKRISLPALFLMEDENRYRVFPAPKSVDDAERVIRGAIIR